MSTRLPKRPLAYFLLLTAALLWGLAAPVVKRGYSDGLTPNAFLLGRYLIAVLTSLPILLVLRKQPSAKRAFKPANLFQIVLLEIFGVVFSLALLYAGLQQTSATEATLITATYPIFMTLGGMIFLHEVIERHQWTGLLIALVGSILLVVNPMVNSHIKFTYTIGNLLVFSQNLTGAVYYLAAKKIYKNLNKWVVIHLSFWVGLLGFAALIYFGGSNPVMELVNLVRVHSFWPLFAIVYMGFAGSTLAATFTLIGNDMIEASEASLFTYLYPLSGIPASMLLLGEKTTPVEIVAVLVTLLGVVLAEKQKRRRRA